MTTTPDSVLVISVIAAFFSVFRFAVNLVSLATNTAEEIEQQTNATSSSLDESRSSTKSRSSLRQGTTKKNKQESNGNTSTSNANFRPISVNDLAGIEGDEQGEGEDVQLLSKGQVMLSYASLVIQLLFFIYFVTMTVLVSTSTASSSSELIQNVIYNGIPLGAAAVGTFFNLLTSKLDQQRKFFSSLQRLFYILYTLITTLGIIVYIATTKATPPPSILDYVTLGIFLVYTILAFIENKVFPSTTDLQSSTNNDSTPRKKKHLGRSLLKILKPYFWPKATPNASATLNRTRAIMTWVCVVSSRTCQVISPIYLGKASTALTRMDYATVGRNAAIFCTLQFASIFLRECQSLVYLRVAQAAFIQLSELSFHHLHSLSLDWHLKKKLGETIRSMDRGILSCDTLMKYLFLWLVPAVGECILVCIIFATYFDYLPLAFSIFTFVFVYITWTIVVTLWRKRFRKAVAKSDNDWHDICTDSLINFETVKYFTAEDYEISRFSNSIKEYQNSSVNVQASLSLLNITQAVLMQVCLGTGLVLAAYGIKKRNDCCMSNGCDDGNSPCCTNLASEGICSGMEIGDFVAVLTYTLNLFMPLNFLGSVYNAIVMAMVDLRNLSELLSEEPDLADAPDAIDMPVSNTIDPDIAAEFNNVAFKYPSQAEGQGLTGVSFKMKRGTTTAIVGSTGAGKTTISRLLFRFYDVSSGSVKVNGVDVKQLTQKSLRQAIGVVPQSTSMFNDTLQENIRYGKRDATMEELDKVAESAQILDFIRTLPEGWDTVIGDRGLKLSGGEKQRTAIARCLLKDPPFVVLDEATSALDTVTENSIQEALDALGSHRTCLVIAHRLTTVKKADNIVVLGDGVVIEQGTHDELLQNEGKYHEMWNMHEQDNTAED